MKSSNGSKGKGNKIKRVLILIATILMLIVTGFLSFILLGKDKALRLDTGVASLSAVEDGTYIGSYHGFRWSNTVEVTVKDHEIVYIQIIKPQVFATEETIDAITNKILLKQSTDVDAISGATADSKAYLKAVENALKGGY